MEKWEIALNKFLKRYINKPWFEGAVLCGSYSVGNQNKFSDIDVTIVASNDLGWNEKANCYIDGFLIEYLINPIYKYEYFMESDFKIHKLLIQNMFANGVILYDKNGAVKKLHQTAVKYYNKKMKPLPKAVNDRTKYVLWCLYDDIKSLHHDGYPVDLPYWSLVNHLITAYCDFNCLPKMPSEKIQKMLVNKEYAKKYHANNLPNKTFTKLLLACFDAKAKDKMSAIDKLYKYVIKSGGGFDIGKFSIRSKIEKLNNI